MLLAAPSRPVLLVLAAIRLIDAFRVHPSVDAAAVTAMLPAGSPDIHQPPSATAALTHKEPL